MDESITTGPATSNGALDTDSQEAFPSLASAPSATRQTAAWGSANGPRIKAVSAKNPVISENFTLSSSEISTTGKDGKQTSLGEVMKQVMAQFKVKIEASTNQKSRQTTFYLKSESKKELDKAKRTLLAQLSPIVRHSSFLGTLTL